MYDAQPVDNANGLAYRLGNLKGFDRLQSAIRPGLQIVLQASSVSKLRDEITVPIFDSAALIQQAQYILVFDVPQDGDFPLKAFVRLSRFQAIPLEEPIRFEALDGDGIAGVAQLLGLIDLAFARRHDLGCDLVFVVQGIARRPTHRRFQCVCHFDRALVAVGRLRLQCLGKHLIQPLWHLCPQFADLCPQHDTFVLPAGQHLKQNATEGV